MGGGAGGHFKGTKGSENKLPTNHSVLKCEIHTETGRWRIGCKAMELILCQMCVGETSAHMHLCLKDFPKVGHMQLVQTAVSVISWIAIISKKVWKKWWKCLSPIQ